MDEMADMALKVLALESMVHVLNEKLAEVMPEDEYEEFKKSAPKRAFYDLFDNCPIPHLRNYALDNFDRIVADYDEGSDTW